MGAVTVRVERDGPVTTVILSRPHARNAVDGPTAAALGLTSLFLLIPPKWRENRDILVPQLNILVIGT